MSNVSLEDAQARVFEWLRVNGSSDAAVRAIEALEEVQEQSRIPTCKGDLLNRLSRMEKAAKAKVKDSMGGTGSDGYDAQMARVGIICEIVLMVEEMPGWFSNQ